ncbi:hypothetical protein Pcinc_004884 [Petrolisthes cinctipes]|uniref:N-chimaerin n=1 Tax=Petrolisthes cinctipes TaxID=88211 RepID=A0AAE1L0P1_PETCI|nr:hypothetical protein Pcinc_004884 [Petrolisthes cinctipes]
MTSSEEGEQQPRSTSSMWKSYLYQLQQEAPTPFLVPCEDRPPDTPPHYGQEYHGTMGRHRCQELLCREGSYLVRHSDTSYGFYTLSLRFNGQIKHYRLYHDGRQHYVGEKRFDCLRSLVADGLVTLYIELKAGEQLRNISAGSYVNSPHYTLTRSIRKQIQSRRKVATNRENVKPRKEKVAEKEVKEEVDGSIFYVSSKKEETVEEEGEGEEKEESCEVTTQRPHRFHVNTFSGLHWCGFCGHFLWGFVWQGVKCQDCGLKAHKQCSCKVPNDCCPDLNHLHNIFGVDLTTSLGVKMGPGSSGTGEVMEVPSVVTECVAEVEARGLTSEGIYRVPGSQEQIEALKLAFERDGNRVSLNERSVSDINVVAGLLKLYLRLLPIPLITTHCFTTLQTVCKLSDPEARLSSIREAVLTLPPAHFATLKAIITHLGRVYEHCAVNKMSATSLSTVFAPTLIQSPPQISNLQPADLLALANTSLQPRVVEVLIIYHRDVFQ